jgi:hypothetical protein
MLFDLKVTLRINIPVPSKMAASAALRQALLSSTVDFDYTIHEIAPVEGNAEEEQLELIEAHPVSNGGAVSEAVG